jgi:FkbM family methyltransferase
MKNLIRKLLAKKFRISYSQLGEDILVSEILRKSSGVSYVDIGANHPVFGSNTFYFYLRGGRGICVEPNKDYQILHEKIRSEDRFVYGAVSDREDKEITFYPSGSPTDAFASFDPQGNGLSKISIPNFHINHILGLMNQTTIDFLSLDTETMDGKIIEAIDFKKYTISVICVETNKDEMETLQIKNLLHSHGYALKATNPVNSIFVKNKNHNISI